MLFVTIIYFHVYFSARPRLIEGEIFMHLIFHQKLLSILICEELGNNWPLWDINYHCVIFTTMCLHFYILLP